jgi:hypothetical protein
VSQQETLVARRRVLEQKLATKTTITSELEGLVRQGGFQRLQLLEQQDQERSGAFLAWDGTPVPW